MDSINGTTLKFMIDCFNNPSMIPDKPEGTCFLLVQKEILASGCVDCLHYIVNHQDRTTQYCRNLTSAAECNNAVAPCEDLFAGGARFASAASDAWVVNALPAFDTCVLTLQ